MIAELAEATPVHALLLGELPFDAHFRRDHFAPPERNGHPWVLEVGGMVRRPLRLDAAGLRALGGRSELVTLECAGHRRTEHRPLPPGLPWGVGALGEARWTGTPLATVLARAGVLPGARAVVLEGADAGPVPGRDEDEPFARALPLAKARAPETLLAWAVGGAAIEHRRGGPVRAIVPGWYATDSVKWLARVTVVADEFTGFFEAEDYRVDGARLTALPVHALVLDGGPELVRGIAWGGEGGVARVDVRADGGPWRPAELGPSRGAYARRFWSARRPASARVLEVRATDAAGLAQPGEPRPNPCGYANNSVHRVEMQVP